MAKERRPGWWYPYIFVGMFGVIIAVNGVLAYFATTTFSGLQTEGAYDKGLKYNQTLAEAEAQKALGWTVTLVNEGGQKTPNGGRLTDIVATFADAKGQPVSGLEVMVVVDRPAQAGFSKELTLVEKGQGRYIAPTTLPMPGQWELRLVAHKNDINYKIAHRILVP